MDEEHTELRDGRRQGVSRAWGAIFRRRDAVVSNLGLVRSMLGTYILACVLQDPAPDGQSGKTTPARFLYPAPRMYCTAGEGGGGIRHFCVFLLLSPVHSWPNLKRLSAGAEVTPPPGTRPGG